MSIIKRARWKDPSGKVTDYDLGANAANVSQDSTHRFVSDTEKNNWNAKLGSTGDGSNLISKFTQASSRTNLVSGEKDSASKGKIMKFFADLKAVAFSGSYNDLSNKPSIHSLANNCTTTAAGYGLDARQGKVLMDKANQLSSEIAAMKRNFQDGVDTIYGKIVSLGVTPSGGKTPNACAASIQTIYDLQYDNGYDDGYAKGKAEIVDLGVINASSQSGSNTRDSTFKLTKYAGYKNISTSNIIFMPVSWKNGGGTGKDMDSFWGPQIKSYDKNTGTVTLRGASGTNYGWGASIASARFIIVT